MLESVPNLGDWTAAVPLMGEGYHRQVARTVELLWPERTIYPAREHVFRALALTPFEATKVVIVGQDPYHGPGQADGLAFSVPDGVPAPPSLRNILREIADDVYGGVAPSASTDLTRWACQGVLLLNASLTVEAGGPGRTIAWGGSSSRTRSSPVSVWAGSTSCSCCGAVCRVEAIADRRGAASGTGSAPSLAPLGLSGLLWLSSFQQSERLPRGARSDSDRVVGCPMRCATPDAT